MDRVSSHCGLVITDDEDDDDDDDDDDDRSFLPLPRPGSTIIIATAEL
jgi:hypothetical protein